MRQKYAFPCKNMHLRPENDLTTVNHPGNIPLCTWVKPYSVISVFFDIHSNGQKIRKLIT